MRINIQSADFNLVMTDDQDNEILSYTRGNVEFNADAGLILDAVGALALRKQAVDNALADNARPDPFQEMMKSAMASIDELTARMRANNARDGHTPGCPNAPRDTAADIDGADATGNNPADPESPVGKSQTPDGTNEA